MEGMKQPFMVFPNDIRVVPGNGKNAIRALLIQLEFPLWKAAKSWGYSGHFGLEEGLHANNVETFILPAWGLVQPDSHLSWLSYAKELCHNQHFDQVWLWLVHCEYPKSFLEWVATLAPVRVGCLYESLSYTREECRQNSKLETRREEVSQQMQGLTHIICSDECDATYIQEKGIAQAIWSPTFVPHRFVSDLYIPPTHSNAAFFGSLYSEERRQWLEQTNLHTLLARPASPEDATSYPLQFDRLHQASLEHFKQKLPINKEVLRQYVDELRRIRQGAFAAWMNGLRQWNGIVNLPSFGKVYTSRVAESMAAGSPAITWEVPNRPRNRRLFEDGKEILLYKREKPDQLAQHLLDLQRNSDLARTLVDNAREKIKRFHTAEFRIQQILQWIQTGTEPCCGEEGSVVEVEEGAQSPEFGNKGEKNERLKMSHESSNVTASEFSHNSLKDKEVPLSVDTLSLTTVFIVTVGDITLPACQEAIRRQDTQAFVLDIIRDMHPMSVAFQEMINRCRTEYFIQVDEDMMLNPDAVRSMESLMQQVPDYIGMICCHLYDEDRDARIQGVKIYRTSSMKSLVFQNVKACEMDVLEQMGQKGIRWILHPSVQGRHGTHYTPETIYRRYKSMYEKDILEWNDVTGDIQRKANQYRETGDPLALFALLGGVDGIVSAPNAKDQEKDFTKYGLKSLEVLRRIFLEPQSFPFSYEAGKAKKRPCSNPPVLLDDVGGQPITRGFSEDVQGQNKKPVPSGVPERMRASSSPSTRKHVLLICHWFWPSVGGVETVVSNLGQVLIHAGYQVDVATVGMAERTCLEYQGMQIISLDDTCMIQPYGIPYLCEELYQLFASGQYDTCFLFGDPLSWLFPALLFGDFHPRTKVFLQPLVNQEGYETWGYNHVHRENFARVLLKANGILALTKSGIATEYLSSIGIQPLYLPNATTPEVATLNFREQYDITPGTFLIVHVANIWKVKNHIGLLQTLSAIPSNWKLVLIGQPFDKTNPEEEENNRRFGEMVQSRPGILYIPGLSKDDVGAALQAADVVVLASHAEVSPMVLVEAMSYGTPWLATPSCGDVADKAGGVVAPLELFPQVLMFLEQNQAMRQSLGKLGYAHWQTCYSWDVVRQGWIELLETGRLSKTYDMPEEIANKMNALQIHFNALLSIFFTQSNDQSSDTFRDETYKEHSPSSWCSLPASRAVCT